MGYVEAFEPNVTMKWVATWFYLIGCVFYVSGSFLAFVTVVAGNQVRWEKLAKEESRKTRSMTSRLARAGTALPRALKRRAGRSKPGSAEGCQPGGRETFNHL